MNMTGSQSTILFPWRPEYSVGFEEIDRQHKLLVKLINDLQEAMYEGRGRDALAPILDDLVHYTETHFAFEEKMLQAGGFTKLVEHQAEHQKLTEQVCELRDQLRSRKIVLTTTVMRFLKNWLADHIMQHDQAYARELKAVVPGT
jgi:hemerythrin